MNQVPPIGMCVNRTSGWRHHRMTAAQRGYLPWRVRRCADWLPREARDSSFAKMSGSLALPGVQQKISKCVCVDAPEINAYRGERSPHQTSANVSGAPSELRSGCHLPPA